MHEFKASDEAGEIADAAPQHRFDALADAARPTTATAHGAYGNNDVAAIRRRGKMEVEMRECPLTLTGKPTALARPDSRNADSPAPAHGLRWCRRDRRQRIAFGNLDPRRVGLSRPASVMFAIGGTTPTDLRAAAAAVLMLRVRAHPLPRSAPCPLWAIQEHS